MKFFPSDWEENILLIQEKDKFSLHHWQDFPSKSMAALRNKRKLAAVSRETPKGSRSSRAQNVLDPVSAQDYISQVSEEFEGRVTKKLSKKFSKIKSRILGALSKLDEFLPNPQVRTCSAAVPGTSRNGNSENRETNEGRSSDDPYPGVGYFPHHSGRLSSPGIEINPHMVTENYSHNNKHVEVNFTDRESRFEMLKNTGKIRWSKKSSKVFLLNPDYTKAQKQQQFEIWQLPRKRKSDEQTNKSWVRFSFVEIKMGRRISI